jgi:hypothetical protein
MHLNQYIQLPRFFNLDVILKFSDRFWTRRTRKEACHQLAIFLVHCILQSEDGLCLAETCDYVYKENICNWLQTIIVLIRRLTVLCATHK